MSFDSVLWNPTTPSHAQALTAMTTASKSLGVELVFSPAAVETDLDGALSALRLAGCRGVVVIGSPLVYVQRARIAELFIKHRLAGIFSNKENAIAGGLISYGVNLVELYRETATYIDKILRGAKAAELPVGQATKLNLVINLKTAKSLDFEVPHSLLLRADEILE